MKITSIGCTIFGLLGQVIANLVSFGYFSIWVYWITNGYLSVTSRTTIHLGLCIFALFFIIYSILMSCHICYVIHHDFDNIRAYFWTRIHLFILVGAFSVLSLVELSMYLEISNLRMSHLLKEILEESPVRNSSAHLHLPEWLEHWQINYKCCGIVSYKDYMEYGDKKSVSPNCCRYNIGFVSENGTKCGDNIVGMNLPFIDKRINTKGCGSSIKESLITISFYGCLSASVTTLFVVISSIYYLTFLKEYSREQHVNRMRHYDSEEREQLKLLSKKRNQQQLLRNSSSNKGPVKAHGTKTPSSSQQSRSRSHSHSRSNSKSHKKTHTSAEVENAEYKAEEKAYIKNVDNRKSGEIKSKHHRKHESSSQSLKLKKEDKEFSTRSLPNQNHNPNKSRSKSRTRSPGGSSGKSRNVIPATINTNKSNTNIEEDYQSQPDYNNSRPGYDYRYYQDENQDFPPFKSNENLFMNLIDIASSRRLLTRNPTRTSSTDFQEDVLVPRVLIRQTKRTKQVLFDQNSNVYYEKDNEVAECDVTEFVEVERLNSNNLENITADINYTEEEDDDEDPGDVIVRQL